MNLKALQKQLFAHEVSIREHADIFAILGNECRLEMFLALMSAGELSSGDIAEVTNCSPSQVSQALAMMRRTGMVTTRREWLNVYYSLDMEHAITQQIRSLLGELIYQASTA